jgi:hypothetical protein
MHTHRVGRHVPIAILPLLALVAAAPAQASPGTGVTTRFTAHKAASHPLAAYVWSGGDKYYSYNSTGKAIKVTDLPTPGDYEVVVDGLGRIGGDAIVGVTAYDTTNTCEVNGWSPSGANLDAFVGCDNFDGDPTATLFDLVVTRPTSPPHGVYDYSFVYDSTASGTLTAYQYNSAHKKNKAKFLGEGRYQVTLGGARSSGTHGTVQVSMYGFHGGECNLEGWHGSRAGEIVDVDCFDINGILTDSEFTLIYASAGNLLGLNAKATANAYNNRSSAASYQPAVQYDSVRHAIVTVKNIGSGLYEVIFKGSEGTPANGGDIQVTTIGVNSQVCTVREWLQSKTPTAVISCVVESDGASLFDAQFVVNWMVA